jgi:hypothetical protein
LDKRRTATALITWKIDPNNFPVNKWIRDIVVIFGEIKDKQILGIRGQF